MLCRHIFDNPPSWFCDTVSTLVVLDCLISRGPWGWLFWLTMVTGPAVLGPSIRVVKEGHAGEARETIRADFASRTLQEGPDVTSVLEIGPKVP